MQTGQGRQDAAAHEGLITVEPDFPGGALQETAWIEVIRKMDEVYSDLIQYEVDLERKNEELEEARRFVSSVLGAMSDVLIVCDRKGRIQDVNAAAEQMSGRQADLLCGLTPDDLLVMPPELKAALPTLAEKGRDMAAIREERPPADAREWDVCLLQADGRGETPLALRCSVRRDQRGRPAGLVLLGRPVGELKQAYEALNLAHEELKQAQNRLIQQEKMASLGRLVAGVAHELNNPISFVYGNAHALERYRQRLTRYLGALHDGADRESLETLRRELRIDPLLDDFKPLIDGTREGASRVADIVKSLRTLSFYQQGEKADLDLAALAREILSMTLKSREEGDRVRIIDHLPDDLQARGEAGQIRQVLVNLFDNALSAMAGQPDAELVISGETGAQGARLDVSDNGPGIAQENLIRVFDPFFTTKAVGEGTGLGLWVSYEIVKQHGGRLWATENSRGGACFSLSLPFQGEPDDGNGAGK